jgi:glycosyltransferase involved in cell wall biosynthesis
MTYIFVTNSLTGGGAERSTNLIVNELGLRKINVVLVPINSSSEDFVTVNSPIMCINRRWGSGLLLTCLSILKFQKYLKNLKPEVLILNCELPELFGALYLNKVKIIVVEHSRIAWQKRSTLGKIIRKILVFRGAQWISVSPIIYSPLIDKNIYSKIIENPVIKLPNNYLNKNLINRLDRIVFIGRLSEEKNPKLIIDVGHDLHINTELIGTGPLLNELIVYAQKLNANVKFSGYKKNPWQEVKNGDLILIPSIAEGDCLVLLEALKIGVPILLNDNLDFRRFNLNDIHYCKSFEDYMDKIKIFQSDLSRLIVPPSKSKEILLTRELSGIINEWEKLLVSVSKK